MPIAKKHVMLVEILATQDYSYAHAETLCDQVLNENFDISKDPVSGIIINAFVDNDFSDYDAMVTGLSYAISMLERAKDRITSRHHY